MTKNEKLDLAILLLVSLLLSLYLSSRTYVISLDGAFQYIPLAKDFASGFYRKALSHNQQPLYSFIIALVSRWVPDLELAGKLVSSIFGILLVFPVYLLGKRIFDEKIAFLSSLLLAIHPYLRRYSADVLKESAYLFFFAIALLFAWKAIQEEKKYAFLFIPLFSVIAYLVRPDGIEVLLIVFFYVLFIKKFSIPGRKRMVILLLLLSSCILFLPYLIHLKETTGVWTLSRAKTMAWFLGLGMTEGEASFIDKFLFSLKRVNFEIFSIYHPLYIFFAMIGLWKRHFSHFKMEVGFLLSFCILHYVVLFLLVLNITEWAGGETIKADHFSGRHVLPLLLFSIYWVGEGIVATHHWIYNKIGSRLLLPRGKTGNRSIIVWGILFLLVAAIVLPQTLKPQRYERLPEKWAGVWIKDQSGKGMTIFTTVPRVAYYADGEYGYIDFNKDKLDKVKASMIEKKAFYLAIRSKEVLDFTENAEAIKRDFAELNQFEGKGMKKVIVYKMIR